MENKRGVKVSNRVAQLRKERGLSQTELGELLYIDQRSVSFIENGNCNLSNLVAIADVFGVTLDYILKRSDDRGNTIKKLDEIDFLILEQFKGLSKHEKERLLRHLELDNSLKISSVI